MNSRHKLLLAGATLVLMLVTIGDLVLTNRRLASALRETQRSLESKRALVTQPTAQSRPMRDSNGDTLTNATNQSQPSRNRVTHPESSPLRNDPPERAARFNQAILGIERTYGKFFERTESWSPERREALKRQLALNQLALMDAISLQHSPINEEQSTAQAQSLQQALAENEQNLRAFLGSEYDEFDGFEKSRTYATTVADITNAMRAKGAQVSDQTEQKILNGYAAAMAAAANEAKAVDPQRLTESQRTELRQRQHRAVQLQLIQHLTGVMEAQQLDSFLEAYLEQQEGG